MIKLSHLLPALTLMFSTSQLTYNIMILNLKSYLLLKISQLNQRIVLIS